jgi:type VI secretion system protein VasG
MAGIDRMALFQKLDPLAYKSLEAATVLCKMRGNAYVELVHWVAQILQQPDSDFHHIIKHYELNASKIAGDVTAAMDRLPRGATAVSDFSPHLEESIERGWVYGSLLYNAAHIRTGHLLVGMTKTFGLKSVLNGISREFDKLKPEGLSDDFAKATAGSPEEAMGSSEAAAAGAAPGETSGAMAPAAMGKQEALAKYSVDLTAKARAGELDPILGRDAEIRQIVDILMRRRQNNPILTGEAGVGKTAVVEGFAQRVAAGDVPPSLKDVSVRTLDLTLMQAGASMKGEFEQRLRSVIDEVQAATKPVILFIDEAHTLIGAGGAAGQGDAANLLKPALARGTLRTIAATTWAEYKKYFEKDPALTRRFQVVQVGEPDEAKAILMLRGLCAALEKHHKVQLLDEAIEAAVSLSHRYIPARQLPDKAVSLLDTACARVAVGQHATPAELEDSKRRIQAWTTELEIVDRESAVGLDHSLRRADVEKSLAAEREREATLEKHWAEETKLVQEILAIRAKLRAAGAAVDPPAAKAGKSKADAVAAEPAKPGESKPAEETPLSAAERTKLLEQLSKLQPQLAALQGESPLVLPAVDAQAVASVVAAWTGIPVGRMAKNQIEQVLKLSDLLEQRVMGQRHGLDLISKRVRTSRAKLDNPGRPVGVFLLVGPSGTGKTETALALAETLYGGEQNLIKINMAEFQEAHTVSTLKGAPPGYVGYGEGGVLTEAVRRRPYSVVLLDEVEKAHHDVHEIFFEVFDKGHMEDGEGRDIDFKNTIILLTSNAAQDVIINMCRDTEKMPGAEELEKALRGPLTEVFPDALLNRLVVVPFYPITRTLLKSIIGLQLSRVRKRVKENHKVPFTFDESVPALIADRCTELERGARMVDAMITNGMLPDIGQEMLTRLASGTAVKRVHVGTAAGEFTYAFD